MPLYETSDHRAEEEIMRQDIEKLWSCNLHKLPMKYSLDYVACRPDQDHQDDRNIVGFVEFKRRRIESAFQPSYLNYPCYMLDVHKISSAQMLWNTFHKPSTLVVKFDDRTGWVKIADNKPRFTNSQMIMAGRKDRNDPNDHQPYILIPMNQFTWIS